MNASALIWSSRESETLLGGAANWKLRSTRSGCDEGQMVGDQRRSLLRDVVRARYRPKKAAQARRARGVQHGTDAEYRRSDASARPLVDLPRNNRRATSNYVGLSNSFPFLLVSYSPPDAERKRSAAHPVPQKLGRSVTTCLPNQQEQSHDCQNIKNRKIHAVIYMHDAVRTRTHCSVRQQRSASDSAHEQHCKWLKEHLTNKEPPDLAVMTEEHDTKRHRE